VSAAWSKIQTTASTYNDVTIAEPKKNPHKKIVETEQTHLSASKSLSWKEAWLDWEKEKTITPAVEVRNAKTAVALQSTSKNKKNAAPILETKYSEPLDAIKDRYINSILKQRQKKGFAFGKASEFIIPSVALIIIFSVAYWLLHNTNETAPVLSATTLKTELPANIKNTNTIPANTHNTSSINNAAQNNVNNSQNINNANQPLSDEAEDRKSFASTTKFTSSKNGNEKQQNNISSAQNILPVATSTTQKTISDNAKQIDVPAINNASLNTAGNDPLTNNTQDLNAQDARPVNRRINTDDISNNASAQNNNGTPFKNTKVKSISAYVSVPEYIQMNNGSADLKIENISDIHLDLAVVDVQYFDASGRFIKGETLYLHNLKAGKNVIVKTPKDINAQYATSKISLVSSDAANVYVIGDN
ncbi:MAG: hypothetical protein ABJB05_15185, partial [Parafilimonas sp.]